LGCILRSRGDIDKSIKAFESAQKDYEEHKHQNNLSRALMNIGVARLYKAHIKENQDRNLEVAKENLELAREVAKSIENLRQEAEILVRLSWLYQSDGMSNVEEAERYAKKALAYSTKVRSYSTMIEAEIALGYCEIIRSEYEKAHIYFEGALKKAYEQGIFKLKVDAHLSLAELSCTERVRNIYSATLHCEKAKKILPTDSSHYLTKKLEKIEKIIEDSREGVFCVTADVITSKRLGLKELERKLQIWAVEQAMRETKEQKGATASMLALSRPGFNKLWKRLFQNNAKNPSESSGDE
jgi:tetratricopeptide (TPR) repeat protein